MNIPGKESSLPHVLPGQQPGGKALQPQAKPSVRRHTVTMHQQIVGECVRIHAPPLQLVKLLLIAVDALAPGGDLHPSEEQVKTQSLRRILRIIHGVERTFGRRVMGHKYKGTAKMFPHILAQQLFFLRLKILLLHHGAVIMLRHQRLGLPETDPGDAAHGQAGF